MYFYDIQSSSSNFSRIYTALLQSTASPNFVFSFPSIYMYRYCICANTICMLALCGDQKKALDFLRLQLHTIVSCHVVNGYYPCPLEEQPILLTTISLAPVSLFLLTINSHFCFYFYTTHSNRFLLIHSTY